MGHYDCRRCDQHPDYCKCSNEPMKGIETMIDYTQLANGLPVWCMLYGEGTIRSFDPSRIEVCFDDNPDITKVSYDMDGKIRSFLYQEYGVCDDYTYIQGNVNRTLFFSKPVVKAELEPPWRAKMKRGDKLIARDRRNNNTFFVEVIEETRDVVECKAGLIERKLQKNQYEFLQYQTV